MTTFSVVQSSGLYLANTVNNRTLTACSAGNILVAIVSNRDGNPASGNSVSDDNSGTWNYGPAVDNEIANANARYAMITAWRIIEPAEDGDNITITGHTAASNNGTLVAEIEPSAAFAASVLGSSGTGGGTGTLDGTSTSTGSISGSDLLHVILQGVRNGGIIGGFEVSEYTPTTEYEDAEYIGGSNQISMAIGVALDGQSASGVVTATSDLTGSNTADAEGIIAQLVFENDTGSTTITGSGGVTTPTPTLAGAGTIARNGTGAATLPVATLSGTGVREITGSGGVTAPVATLDGSGTVGAVVTGTGAATLPLATLDGTGLREITGTGAATLPGVTISGAGLREVTGSGGVTSPVPTLDGSGEIAGAISGSGAITAPAATISGTGLREITGSGGVSAPVPAIDGTGELSGIVGGSGGVTAPSVTISGAGKIARDGTGAITAPIVTLSGTGTVEELQPGTGAVVIPLPSLSGTGARASVGSGTASLPIAVLAGTGIRTAVGTGAITLPLVTLYGVQVVGGIRVERVGGGKPSGTLNASANNGTLTPARETGS